MFLCDKCHDPGCWYTDMHLRSKGPCEGCGRTSTCYDCPTRSYKNPSKRKRPKRRKAA